MNHPTLLLVEDERESADLIANYLEMNDYRVLTAYDGNKAAALINAEADAIDLAILDIMVPGKDGKELCRIIRNHPVLADIPVLFLTARDEERDEIEGLELGADAYLTKPAGVKLVKAHIDNLLRRRRPEKSGWLHYGSVYLDTEARQIYLNDEPLEATSTEYTILELFFRHPRRVFSRQEILGHIGGEQRDVFDRTVDVHIKNLRIKLGEEGELIKTYRGVGYGMNRERVRA